MGHDIILRGPYYEPNSHGGTIRNLAIALHKVGCRVKLVNCPSGLWNNFPLKLNQEHIDIIKSLEKTQVRAREYVHIQHIVPNQFIYDPYAALNIGYASFETDGLPLQWLLPMQAMNKIFTPSFQNMHAFKNAGVTRPITVVPHGYDPEIYNTEIEPMDTGDQIKNAVKFGACFDWTPRKNGLNMITGFLHALRDREDAVLILKVYFKNPSMILNLKKMIADIRANMKIGPNPRIVILPDVIADYQMGAFYRSIDVLISLSQGEGFNKPVLEAMACGTPAIVTGWGGHMDFCNASNSLFINDNPMGPVGQDQIANCGDIYANQNWAYPNLQVYIDNLMYFMENHGKEEILVMKQNAVRTASVYTWNNVALHVKEVLDE